MATARNRAERAEALLARWASSTASTSIPTSSPPESASAWPSPAPWPTIPPSCWPTSPPANLDSVNSARIMEMLTGIQQKRGMTLIVVTHENDIANAAPRHIRIRDGRIES
jgi:hypothetical protein